MKEIGYGLVKPTRKMISELSCGIGIDASEGMIKSAKKLEKTK